MLPHTPQALHEPFAASVAAVAAGPVPAYDGARVGTPMVWAVTVTALIGLFLFDFAITRKPHEVSLKEAAAWSAFYLAVPLAFGAWVWFSYGSGRGLEFYTGFLVEKTLSIDNLFIFLLLLGSFAVPRQLQQRVLLIGIAAALVLRAIFIALGATLIAQFSWTFLLFGAILVATAVKVYLDARTSHDTVDVSSLGIVRLLRRFYPVTDGYHGPRLAVRLDGRRHLTPMALVIAAIFSVDIVFAVDSVPAVYGITDDPYLVFVTNAFALLGLRALYFVLEGVLGKLKHLGYGLAFILAFIGAKLMLHWAHKTWPSVPEIPTLASLGVIVITLTTVTITSLVSARLTYARPTHRA